MMQLPEAPRPEHPVMGVTNIWWAGQDVAPVPLALAARYGMVLCGKPEGSTGGHVLLHQ